MYKPTVDAVVFLLKYPFAKDSLRVYHNRILRQYGKTFKDCFLGAMMSIRAIHFDF